MRSTESVRNLLDAFLLAKLEEKGLSFSPEADRPALIRRATFDLTGLPPTPAEVEAFLADPRPDAYERLIDRLLASPRYGERWGRHWLDVAGYADSDGDNADPVRPWAYKYRDQVIRAFNSDKPFDQFIQEQLAGDELLVGQDSNPDTVHQDWNPDPRVEKLVATRFLRVASDPTGIPGVEQGTARNQVMADTLKIVSSSLSPTRRRSFTAWTTR